MKLIKAMATVAGMTALSRIAGFIRDILTAAYLGAGPMADAFFVALKLPNFFRRITAEGAFSISFVPLYSKMLENDMRAKADDFANNAFTLMCCVLTVFTIIVLIFMPHVLGVVAPGFGDEPEKKMMAIEFSRITFPYLLLISLTALMGGVLNAHHRYAPFAFAPVLFNLSLIGSILFSSFFQNVGMAMSCGLLISGFLQLGFLWGALRRAGLKIKFVKPELDKDTRQVFKLMGPAMIGAGVIHINLFADMIIASYLKTGAISHLYYADRLNQLPLGTVGIAVGTALLPMLSRAMARPDNGEARDLFNRAMEYCMILALPAAVALVTIPHILMSVLFERGAFTQEDTLAASGALLCYAIGLPAYIAIKVFSTAHWAREDTITPVKISVAGTILNIILSLSFIPFIGVAGIALGTGIVGWLQCVAHLYSLREHPHARFDERFKRNILKVIASSCIMGAGLFILAALLQGYIDQSNSIAKVMALALIVLAGITMYAVSIFKTGAVNIKDVKKYLLRGRKT